MGPENPRREQTGNRDPRTRGDTVSDRTTQSYDGRARTRECVDSDSGDDAKQAPRSTFHARSGEVLWRCRRDRGEKRRFRQQEWRRRSRWRHWRVPLQRPKKVWQSWTRITSIHQECKKKVLDRKTNHQGLVKVKTKPRPAKPPLWRDKVRQSQFFGWGCFSPLFCWVVLPFFPSFSSTRKRGEGKQHHWKEGGATTNQLNWT